MERIDFWIFIIFIGMTILLISRVASKQYQIFFSAMLMCILVFISSFQYQLGTDYDSYITLFETTTLDNIYPEYTFRLIVTTLRTLGFEYQMVFLVYSVGIYFFAWMTLRYYVEPEYLVIAIFLLFSYAGYLDMSLNTLRQCLAVSIFSYATLYVEQKKILMYFGLALLAASFHLSAIITMPLYWFLGKKYSTIVYLFTISFAIIISKTNIIPDFLMIILDFAGVYSNYLIQDSEAFFGNVGTNVVFNLTLMMYFLVLLNKEKVTSSISINIFTLKIIFLFMFSFSMTFERIVYYFSMLSVLIFIDVIKLFNRKSQGFVIGLFCLTLAVAYIYRQSKFIGNPQQFLCFNLF